MLHTNDTRKLRKIHCLIDEATKAKGENISQEKGTP